ncbi:cryptochrome/photolyase family protein, partial [Streptomyces cavourensis]|nr:cryptochrome/photolyase family protein [Streptomyces cavourensis]
MAPHPHWLFGDQLGPHFLDPRHGGPDDRAPVVMIEARSVLRRRRFHRAKAHLVLSAMRHRAAELGDRVTYIRAETYGEGLEKVRGSGPLTVCHPTSRRALEFVRGREGVQILPAKGFLVSHDDFAEWAGKDEAEGKGQGKGQGRGQGKGGGNLRLEGF